MSNFYEKYKNITLKKRIMENKSQEAPVNTMTAAFKKWQRSIAAINSEFEIWQAGAEWAFKSVPKSVQVEGLRVYSDEDIETIIRCCWNAAREKVWPGYVKSLDDLIKLITPPHYQPDIKHHFMTVVAMMEKYTWTYNWSDEFLKNFKAKRASGQEKDAVGLSEPMKIICDVLRADKSDGSYYYSWQANIAMAFKDEFEKERQERKDFTRWLFMDGGLHEISNNAAKRFLDLLTYQPESIGRQDAVGQDVEWKNILNFFKGEYVLNNNTTIEEIIRDLKMRYTLYLNRDKK